MEFRSSKIASKLDHVSQIAQSITLQATGKKLDLISGPVFSANGDGGTSSVYCGVVATPGRWRVVGIGGIVGIDGHDQTAEIGQWGHQASDLGGTDNDAFGQVTMDNDAGDAWNAGEILYQGTSPYNDFFGFDPLADAEDEWDIVGPGAGVLMGEWQTKATILRFTKANVATSDAIILGFFLVEYETGGGVE